MYKGNSTKELTTAVKTILNIREKMRKRERWYKLVERAAAVFINNKIIKTSNTSNDSFQPNQFLNNLFQLIY